ncbi:hypothetical protein HY772_07530 [Candidatus Woesearchaeota archaeon]|nr:hypothetical protein [Candidatus Woesearchaeota archaeon]
MSVDALRPDAVVNQHHPLESQFNLTLKPLIKPTKYSKSSLDTEGSFFLFQGFEKTIPMSTSMPGNMFETLGLPSIHAK